MDPATMALVSSGVGLVGGYFQSQAQADAARAQAAQQREALAAAQKAADEGYVDISQLYNPYVMAGNKAFQEYGERDFSYAPEQFQYDQTLGDFLDPSMQFQIDQAMQAIQGSAAAGGSLGSGATLKAMQDRGQQIASTGYGQAQDRMMQDKNFAYNQFLNNANAKRQQLAAQENQLLNIANTGFQGTQQQAGSRAKLAGSTADFAQQAGNIAAPGYISNMRNAAMIGQMTDPQMLGALGGSFSSMGGNPQGMAPVNATAPGGNLGGGQPMAAAPNYYQREGLA